MQPGTFHIARLLKYKQAQHSLTCKSTLACMMSTTSVPRKLYSAEPDLYPLSLLNQAKVYKLCTACFEQLQLSRHVLLHVCWHLISCTL